MPAHKETVSIDFMLAFLLGEISDFVWGGGIQRPYTVNLKWGGEVH